MIFENLDNLPSINDKVRRTKPSATQNRSHLMVRADNPKHLNKLDALSCDVATINLEDGISPQDKPKALELTKLFLSHLKISHAKIIIRVNEIDNGGLEEIKALMAFKPDGFRIPKLRSLEELEQIKNITGDTPLYATIETKEAFTTLDRLAASGHIKVAYLGLLDLLSDLNLPQHMIEPDNDTVKYLMSEFVVKCRTHGVLPVSFTYQEYKNTERYEQWCMLSKYMGFAGQSCIAPIQAEIANSVFGHSKEEIVKAREIKALFEASRAKGVTGFAHEKYGFIDEPIYRDALTILG